MHLQQAFKESIGILMIFVAAIIFFVGILAIISSIIFILFGNGLGISRIDMQYLVIIILVLLCFLTAVFILAFIRRVRE